MNKKDENYVNGLVEETEENTLSVFVYDSISVSETIVVDLIVERITTWKVKPKGSDTVVSVEEYRKLVNDFTSSDERVEERLQYLEAFVRNIIRPELEKIYE
jgi:hypothetical protein